MLAPHKKRNERRVGKEGQRGKKCNRKKERGV
jgi:hypothetical protein